MAAHTHDVSLDNIGYLLAYLAYGDVFEADDTVHGFDWVDEVGEECQWYSCTPTQWARIQRYINYTAAKYDDVLAPRRRGPKRKYFNHSVRKGKGG